MSELALFLVRFGFMAVLWIFIFSIIGVIRADLFGQRVVGKATERSVPQVLSTPIIPAAPSGAVSVVSTSTGKSSGVATRLVIIEGEHTGTELPLNGRELHIGRAPNSDLVINDEYASTQHAKLVLMNEDWLIQDLNSTNGTYLAGARVGTPAVVKLNTPVKIGKTVFELRA
jgi:pSer/pThr/pTyr-binding forkhead associated (FHA) protein